MWPEAHDRETAVAFRRDEINPAMTRMSRAKKEKLGELCGQKREEVKGDWMMGDKSAAPNSMTPSPVVFNCKLPPSRFLRVF